MKKIVLLILIVGQIPVSAQKLTRAEVLEDLNFLKQNIEKYNPALPHYNPDFEKLTSAIISEVPAEPINVFEYFSMVSKISALANEGHFGLGNWEDVVHKGFLEDTYAYLPLSVRFVSGKLYAWNDYSNERQLEKGNEIISINGQEATSLISKLVEVTPSDGNILTYAYRNIELGFNWQYYVYIEQADAFEIVYADKSGAEKQVTIEALIRSDHVANIKKYFADTKQDTPEDKGFYELDYTNDYALFKLPSFDFRRINKYEVKAKSMYKSIFYELKENDVKNLIIDLRNNTGGRNEFADDMTTYIMKNSNGDPHLKETVSWEGKVRTYSLPKASKLAFEGTIYVLVNGKTYSAGNSLARILKEYGNATIIGTETGTRYEGFAGGSSQDITLPNTQMNISIPRYHIAYPPSKKQTTTNRGLLPDHEINYSIDDLINEKDLHMEKVIALIRNDSD